MIGTVMTEREKLQCVCVYVCKYTCASAFVLRLLLVEQADVCEGEMAFLALALSLPLAVHVDFRHRHHVAHLHTQSSVRRDTNKQTNK